MESHLKPIDVEKRRVCGKLRFRPYKDYTPPDPSVVFESLPHNATIVIIGDSISMQHGVDFFCAVASISETVNTDIARLPSGYWCTSKQSCDVDYKGMGQIYWIHATFRSYHANESGDRVVINISFIGEQKGQKYLREYLERGKRGDVIVMNQGLHYMKNFQEKLLMEYTQIKLQLLAARSRGVELVWRETSAAHFDTKDGYYREELGALQENKSVTCIPSSMIESATAKNVSNGLLVPFMRSLSIPVLETFDASFLIPAYCHVAQGIDCVHFLQPGASSFFTESLLKHIEDNV